jgi:hypothetical protein
VGSQSKNASKREVIFHQRRSYSCVARNRSDRSSCGSRWNPNLNDRLPAWGTGPRSRRTHRVAKTGNAFGETSNHDGRVPLLPQGQWKDVKEEAENCLGFAKHSAKLNGRRERSRSKLKILKAGPRQLQEGDQ